MPAYLRTISLSIFSASILVIIIYAVHLSVIVHVESHEDVLAGTERREHERSNPERNHSPIEEDVPERTFRALSLLSKVQRDAFLRPENTTTLKVVFAHATKAAGTTTNRVLEKWASSLSIPYREVRALSDVISSPMSKISGIYSTEVPRRFWFRKAQQSGYVQFTIIREPLDRCVSWYHFRRADIRPKFALFRKMSFYQFLQVKGCNNYYLTNYQTEWSAPWKAPGKPGQSAFATPPAKNVLPGLLADLRQNFLVVGLAENLAESLEILRVLAGWPRQVEDMLAERHNVNTKRVSVDEISARDKNLFYQLNKGDMLIYRHAQDYFNRTRTALTLLGAL
jgi:hypothetical protein